MRAWSRYDLNWPHGVFNHGEFLSVHGNSTTPEVRKGQTLLFTTDIFEPQWGDYVLREFRGRKITTTIHFRIIELWRLPERNDRPWPNDPGRGSWCESQAEIHNGSRLKLLCRTEPWIFLLNSRSTIAIIIFRWPLSRESIITDFCFFFQAAIQQGRNCWLDRYT